MQNPSQDRTILECIKEQERVACEFGFYWQNIDQLIEQIRSECVEIQEAWQKKDQLHLQEEIGDLLLAAVSLAIFCQVDPHVTLCKSSEKYQKRYDCLVALAQKDGHSHLHDQSYEVLMNYWNRAKQN